MQRVQLHVGQVGQLGQARGPRTLEVGHLAAGRRPRGSEARDRDEQAEEDQHRTDLSGLRSDLYQESEPRPRGLALHGRVQRVRSVHRKRKGLSALLLHHREAG